MLKELVVCKFAGCNKVYNDARFLPCGNRTCASHVDAMLVKSDDINSDDRKMIKCHFCEEIHSFPDNGKEFPVDNYVQMLLNMKYCTEHEAAKKSFNEVTQLLDKLINLDKEAYASNYFERVEADILLEKKVKQQELDAFYQKLVDQVHERKVKCLQNLKTNKRLESELDAIKQALLENEGKLKKESLDFILKTLDGEDKKWKEIQTECENLLKAVKSMAEELNGKIVDDQIIGFRPNTSGTYIESICGSLFEKKNRLDDTRQLHA